MASPGFSIAMLNGMRQRGFDDAAMAEVLGISPSKLKSIVAGNAQLTDKQLSTIQRETGVFVGRLAVSTIEPRGGPYTRHVSKLARCVSVAPRPRRRAARSA